MLGKTISHYRILSVLGKGGMGVVYKAEDTRLGRTVALKFLPEELATDRASVDRFQREARAVSVLNHPNICTLHDIDSVDGQLFLVMEYVEGGNLRDRIQKKPLSLEELLDVAAEAGVVVLRLLGGKRAMADGALARDLKEMIAVGVSAINACEY